MDAIQKAARVEKQALAGEELALINRQALKELTEEEVFVFRVAACDNQVDREQERFTEAALDRLAELYVGKTVIPWIAGGRPTARRPGSTPGRGGVGGRAAAGAAGLHAPQRSDGAADRRH